MARAKIIVVSFLILAGISFSDSVTAEADKSLEELKLQNIRRALEYEGYRDVGTTGSGRTSGYTSPHALPVDKDDDGMPDQWELDNGLNPNDPGDAWLDSDGDRVVNLFEYQLGSGSNNPTTPPIATVAQAGADYSDVAAAIDDVAPGTVIRVAGGSYLVNYRTFDSKIVMIQGGWNADFSQRDLSLSSTTFDGQMQGEILYFSPSSGESVVILDGINFIRGNGYFGAVNLLAGGTTFMTTSILDCSIIQSASGDASYDSVLGLNNWNESQSDRTIANTLIADNTASGIYSQNTGDSVARWRIVNTTISDNLNGGGSQGYGIDVFTLDNGSLTARISNGIIWGNERNDLNYRRNITFGVDHSDIGNVNAESGAVYAPGDGVIYKPPLFTYSILPENLASAFVDFVKEDYRLSDLSPCIGLGASDGIPATDIAGSARPDPAGSSPDVGVYENTRSEALPYPIILTSPNGREGWIGGDAYDITWQTGIQGIDHVRLLYSTDGGATYPNTIAANTENDGIYEWDPIPELNSAEVRMKAVAEANDNSILGADASDHDFTIDSSAPSTPIVVDEGDSTNSATHLAATWTSSDPESGIARYEYAIGTSPGGTDVLDWKYAGMDTNINATGLNLTDGGVYYFAVKARNGVGLWSDIGVSDGITVMIITDIHIANSGNDITGNGTQAAPYRTIQRGIDASDDSYTVLVADGIYKGIGNVNLELYGKAITVKSESNALNCIIDCENIENTRGFYLHNDETQSSVIDGFTIRNGNAEDGGAIYCDDSSPTITNNIIMDNSSVRDGGGIHCEGSSAIISRNTITGNSAEDDGGGICSNPSSALTVISNTIIGNSSDSDGGGICCWLSSMPILMTNNVIAGNMAEGDGGGIRCSSYSSPDSAITSNTIVGNTASDDGGGISCYDSSLTVRNTILWNNAPQEIYVRGSSTITISYSDVQGGQSGIVKGEDDTVNWDTSNIYADPLFADAANHDYHLSDPSPCIGKGTNSGAPAEDIEGNTRGTPPDIGAYENSLNGPPPQLVFQAFSPVDLMVTDPDGRMISKDTNTIPSASYVEVDVNGDGDPDDKVTIPDPLTGNYSIQVLAEQGATPTDTYSLDALYGSKSTRLAEDIKIQDIPYEPYSFPIFATNLVQGWNLISIPLLPSSTDPDDVLDSIRGRYNSVWAYDPIAGWSIYAPGAPSDLEEIVPCKGYWIKMDEQETLVVQGTIPDSTAVLLRGAEWNLAGYCSLESIDVEDCNLPDCINSVWEYNAQEGSWYIYAPGGPSDLVSMKPGFGYWIKVRMDHPGDCTWDLNQPSPPAAPPLAVGSRSSYAPGERPEMPYIVWGSVQVDGEKMTGEGVVILKVNDEVQSSCILRTAGAYGNSYMLYVPASVESFRWVELHVQTGEAVMKAGIVPPGRQGQIMRFDLAVRTPPELSQLHQNYPNPFNPDTWIPYQLSEDTNVVIKIYTATGQIARTLNLGHKTAGFYTDKDKAAYWDGKNEVGEHVASGVYFYSIQTGSYSAMRKMTVVQ